MDWILLAQDGFQCEDCEYDSRPLGSIKGSDIFGQLNDCQYLKKESAAWNEYLLPETPVLRF